MYNVAIIGAGKIGGKRARAVANHTQSCVRVIASRTRSKAEALAIQCGADVASDWESVVSDPNVDIVIVSTSNDMLCTIACAAAANGKGVLCEKPLGRNLDEARKIVAAFTPHKRLKVGFNYRFHPAIQKAKSLLQENAIGKVIFLRARYGTGARPGLENEWRGKKEIAGGGELLDQGIHICDLFRWFSEEEFCEYSGMTSNLFWQMETEDNAMALMRSTQGILAQFHVSWTQWKNIFSVDMFGQDGYILLNGLGGHYGVETLTLAKRRSESGPPDQTHSEFAGEDLSWEREWAHFVDCLSSDTLPSGNAFDALAAMEMVHHLYVAASTHQTVRLAR